MRYLLLCLAMAALAGFLAGCSGVRKEKESKPAPVVAPVPAEFVIADNANDTWNTVGQILVRTPGVEYESRAQMMGLYTVRYRDQAVLIRAQPVVLEKPGDVVRTRVFALLPDGKPDTGKPAHELLAMLEQRVPLEIEKYRVPVKLKPAKKAKPKAKKKPKKR
ncbi:MAG TPA: hypothetical protein VJ806_00340 [Luteimonas sp.]|nr:hypothetical protein [Luteimonas sp.]